MVVRTRCFLEHPYQFVAEFQHYCSLTSSLEPAKSMRCDCFRRNRATRPHLKQSKKINIEIQTLCLKQKWGEKYTFFRIRSWRWPTQRWHRSLQSLIKFFFFVRLFFSRCWMNFKCDYQRLRLTHRLSSTSRAVVSCLLIDVPGYQKGRKGLLHGWALCDVV